LFLFFQNHQITSSLPPLPEGGEVDDRDIVADDAQATSRPESETAGSHKSAGSSERESESEATESAHSLPQGRTSVGPAGVTGHRVDFHLTCCI
jgi:hypothetical protein